MFRRLIALGVVFAVPGGGHAEDGLPGEIVRDLERVQYRLEAALDGLVPDAAFPTELARLALELRFQTLRCPALDLADDAARLSDWAARLARGRSPRHVLDELTAELDWYRLRR